ncbi:hypothetical protein [Novosphingobium sp. Chol11]|uniref:hypothetical protein n=1 Tax=Novosphingobium sp. Chol11 TaxID=1385763 RepID=UPI0025D6CFB9|nr:hypothetical protein [Novosphingobium sp. Chol11]
MTMGTSAGDCVPLDDAALNPCENGACPGEDATAALQLCHDICVRNGGGRIVIDRPLLCTSVTERGGLWTTLEFWGDDITLQFQGEGSLEFPRGDLQNYRPMIVGGMAKLGSQARKITTQRCVDAVVHPIEGPLQAGASVVPLADTRHYRAGDIVYLRTGQLLSKLQTEPDAELAKVRAVRDSALELEGPLAKPYQQEFDLSDGRTSPRAHGSPAPYGIVNVSDRVTRNFTMINPVIRASGALQLLSIWSVWGFRSDGGTLTFGNNGVGSRDSRFVHWNTPLVHTGRVPGSYALAPSTGCSDWDVVWDVRSPTFTFLHIHEGVARSRFRGRLRLGGEGGKGPGLSIAARAYDIDIQKLDIDTGNSDQAAIIVRDDVMGGVHFHDLSVRNRSTIGSAIRIDTPQGVTFSKPPVFPGANRVLKTAIRKV